ncbi:MAG TPA: hypothetical protein VM580_09610, partial [Labilithrix sp.]|nr:hypothetical protein [Labilithrix sp.]
MELGDYGGDEARRRQLGKEAHAHIVERRFEEAIAIFDALLPYTTDATHHCNALWVVQADNTGRPVDRERALRYLALALPWAAANPPIHLNAAGVLAEIEAHEGAMTQLLYARRRKVDLAPHLGSALFDPLRSDPRWTDLTASEPPEVALPSVLVVARDAVVRGAHDDAVPALLWRWRQTRSVRLATLLDRIAASTGRRSGYCGAHIEEAMREDPSRLPRLLQGSSRVLRDGRGGYGLSVEPGAIWLSKDCEDPRFTTAVLALLAKVPPSAPRKHAFEGWSGVVDTLIANGDMRALDALRDFAPNDHWLSPGLVKARDALRAQTSSGALDDDEAALCCEMEARLPPVDPPAPIATLETAAEVTTDERGLAARLLADWQRTRSPRVADLLDLAGWRRARDEMREAPANQDEWLALEAGGRADDAPLLLASLVGDDATEAAERIWTFAKREDPRLATALVALLAKPPFIAPREHDNGVEEFWCAVFESLEALGDTRAHAPVAEFGKRVHAICADADDAANEDMYTQSPLGPFLGRLAGEAKDALRARKPSAETNEAWDAIEAELARAREERDA